MKYVLSVACVEEVLQHYCAFRSAVKRYGGVKKMNVPFELNPMTRHATESGMEHESGFLTTTADDILNRIFPRLYREVRPYASSAGHGSRSARI